MSVHRRARTSRQSSNPQKSKKNAALRQAALTACPTSGFEPLERRQLMTLVQPAGQDYLAFEAEDPQATFTDLGDADTVTWERISGAAAYGTLSAPIGGAAIIANRPAGGTANDAGSASYPIQLTNAGPYFFYARVKYTSSGGDNSMYLPPDGGNINADPTAQWDNRTDSIDNYHWNNLDVNGVSFDFTNPTPGAPTTLKMNIRENGYVVDRIILSEVARTPAELDAISPAAPQAASATTKGPEANTVTVTFTPVVDATGYNVYRSTNPTTGFVKLNTDPLGASETTYADNTGTAGTTYYYYVKPVMAGGVEGPQTNTVSATPGWGLIGHYYNDGFWGTGNGNSVTPYSSPTTEVGGVVKVVSDGNLVDYVPQVNFNWGTGSPAPGIRNDNHSTVFVGKIRPSATGAYQIAGFGDDDTHVFVDGQLVSSDPGGHGIPGTDAAGVASIDFKKTLNLTANTDYDIVVLQAEGGGGSGVFLRWTTPTNTAYTDVPNANLRQITSAPAAPTGLARSTTTNVGGVQIDFTDVAKNELRYELEKSTDNGATWALVNSPAAVVGIDATKIYDPQAQVGSTAMYRVVAINFDGRGESAPITVTVPAPTAGPGATGYYFNSQFWGDASTTNYAVSVADVIPDFTETVPQISFDYGGSSPKPGVIRGDNHSTVFTGKLRPTETGQYQILGFTDDDSYVFVNGQLVSADPGGHGIPGNDPGGIASIDFRRPIFLTAGQDYNFVAMQSEGGGGSGIFLRWSPPSANGVFTDIPASAYVSNIPSAAPDKANGSPADITGFAATEVGETRAFLTWNDNSANELRYVLEKADNSAFTGAEVIRLPINASSYTDTALSGGIRYFYRLRAENNFGDSANATVNFQTRASGAGELAPTAPSNVRARPSTNGVLVTFVDTSGFEDSFVVQRQNPDLTWTDVGTVAAPAAISSTRGNALSFEDTAPVNPGTNTYRVLAVSGTQQSAPSNTATVTLPPPAAGTGLTAEWFNEMFFRGPGVNTPSPVPAEGLFGGASPGAGIDPDTFSGTFEGYFQPDTTEAYTFLANSDDGIAIRLWDPTGTNLLIDFNNINTFRGMGAGFVDFPGTVNLTAGTKYPMQVRFNEGGGDANYRVGYSTPTLAPQVIPTAQLYPVLGTEAVKAPAQFRALTAIGPENVGFQFEDLSLAETGYEVERGTSPSGPFTTITLSPDSTTYIEDPAGLTNGMTLYYRVRTTGPGGPSAFTSQIAVPVNFNGTNLALNGTATYLNGADNVRGTADDEVRIMDNVNDSRGSIYTTQGQQIVAPTAGPGGTEGFTASFDFRNPERSGDPADGFGFVIQRNNPNVFGGGGGGQNYSGVGNSIAVILDFYPTGTGRNETNLNYGGEINDNGIATGLNFVSGDKYHVTITYDKANAKIIETITNTANPAQTFTQEYTSADGPGTATAALDNLPGILGGNYAFVGIAGATGGENAELEVSNFIFNGRTLLPQPAASANLTDIYVKSSAWTTAFTTYLESKGLGDDVYGYKVLGNGTPVAGPAGNTDNVLPWINMDQVVLKYSGTPTTGIPTPGTNWLTSQKGVTYTVTAVTPVAGDPTAYVLTLDKPLGGGNPVTGVAPTTGENGDHITVAIPNSGPGGSTVSIRMNVLQGDTDHTGEVGGEHSVLAADFSAVKKKFFKDTTSPVTGTDADYSPFHDVNGSGNILANDFSEVKKRFFQNLAAAAAPAGDMFSVTRVAEEVLA